jgi:sarcosine oxidase subunit alpha
MLGENGFIFDDGIVARLGPDLFHVTTSSGGAARVFAHMEDYLQTEWSHLKVHLTSTTEQWGIIAVQGTARPVGRSVAPRSAPRRRFRSHQNGLNNPLE